jgi:hypothetical protein
MGFQIGEEVTLTEVAIADGCTAKALGADRGHVNRIHHDGMIDVLIKGEPLRFVSEYWESAGRKLRNEWRGAP